jgi:hypothetical protein
MKKSSKRGEVGDELQESTPQAAQTGAQPGNGKRQGKAVDGASKAPGRTGKPAAKGSPAGRKSVNTERRTDHLFKAGQPSANPNGRPKGSRNKFSENLISAFCADFARNGPGVIAAVRSESPVDYLRLAVSIVPKQFGIEEGSEDCFLKLWQAISVVGQARLKPRRA